MTDIIWGNGLEVLSKDSFILKVTHQKNGNKEKYSDSEKVKITSANLPGISHNQQDWTPEALQECTKDAFLKCEVEKREEGILLAKVSHSGVGGY